MKRLEEMVGSVPVEYIEPIIRKETEVIRDFVKEGARMAIDTTRIILEDGRLKDNEGLKKGTDALVETAKIVSDKVIIELHLPAVKLTSHVVKGFIAGAKGLLNLFGRAVSFCQLTVDKAKRRLRPDDDGGYDGGKDDPDQDKQQAQQRQEKEQGQEQERARARARCRHKHKKSRKERFIDS